MYRISWRLTSHVAPLLISMFAHGSHNAGHRNHHHAKPGKWRRPVIKEQAAPYRYEQEVGEIQWCKTAAICCLIGAAEADIADDIETGQAKKCCDQCRTQRRPANQKKRQLIAQASINRQG